MGLFSFIKNAGAKVFGIGKTEEEEKAESGAKKIVETINTLGLEVQGLEVSISEDTVTVKGEAKDQATKEKIILVAGNNEGIATVDDQMTVEIQAEVEPQAEAQFYTVVSGDNLSKIAKQHYQDASKYPVIFEANKPMLSHPDKIYPGQVLRIPALS